MNTMSPLKRLLDPRERETARLTASCDPDTAPTNCKLQACMQKFDYLQKLLEEKKAENAKLAAEVDSIQAEKNGKTR